MLLSVDCIQRALSYNQKRRYSYTTIVLVQEAVAHVGVAGVWSEDLVQHVAAWQAARGLVIDGMVGPQTLRFVQEYVAASAELPTLHPLPVIRRMWGYDHCPDTFKKPCPAWHAATMDDKTIVNGLLRLVSGAVGERDCFSRSPDSWISLDELSIGFPHWWAETAPAVLSAIATECRLLAEHAWGSSAAEHMCDVSWLRSRINAKRGKRGHQAKYNWLLSGWWEIAQHPDVVAVCVRRWVSSYIPPALHEMQARSWSKGTTFAGLVRITNSGGGGGLRSLLRRATRLYGTDETVVMQALYTERSLYGHEDRWRAILKMPHFDRDAPIVVPQDVPQIDKSKIVRADGTKPSWLAVGL